MRMQSIASRKQPESLKDFEAPNNSKSTRHLESSSHFAGFSSMTLKAVSVAIGVGLMASYPPSVFASNSPADRDFDQRFYLGAGTGLSKLSPDPQCPCMEVGDDGGSVLSLFAGLDLSKRFSIEGYYTDLNEADIQKNTGMNMGSIGYTHYGLSGLAYLYNTRRAEHYARGFDDEGYFRREGLSPYVRLGIGAMDNSSQLAINQKKSAHLHAGIGLEYGWSSGLAGRLELTSYDEDAKALHLSVLKRFGTAHPYVAPVPPAPEPVIAPAPAPAPKIKQQAKVLELPKVHFPFDEDALTGAAKQKLNQLSDTLKPLPKLKLEVRGHTDSRGSEVYNQGLSERRAKAVKRYLEDAGTPNTLIPVGYGESQPIGDNNTDEGRQLNRRVDFEVLGK